MVINQKLSVKRPKRLKNGKPESRHYCPSDEIDNQTEGQYVLNCNVQRELKRKA
jgi:hypothetical protein